MHLNPNNCMSTRGHGVRSVPFLLPAFLSALMHFIGLYFNTKYRGISSSGRALA